MTTRSYYPREVVLHAQSGAAVACCLTVLWDTGRILHKEALRDATPCHQASLLSLVWSLCRGRDIYIRSICCSS